MVVYCRLPSRQDGLTVPLGVVSITPAKPKRAGEMYQEQHAICFIIRYLVSSTVDRKGMSSCRVRQLTVLLVLTS